MLMKRFGQLWAEISQFKICLLFLQDDRTPSYKGKGQPGLRIGEWE